MKKLTNLNYVELYAQKMKNDNSLFRQQKKLIESRLQGSSSLFKKMFVEGSFKKEAREYLKSVGLLPK